MIIPNTPERMQLIKTLQYELRTMADLKKMSAKTQQRAQSFNIYGDGVKGDKLKKADPMLGGVVEDSKQIKGLISLIGTQTRSVEKLLLNWPLYSEWLVNVPGVGGMIAGELIFSWYYKNVAICHACGADLVEFDCPDCGVHASGAGNLKFRHEMRDFPNLAKWYKFTGMHVAFDEEKDKWVKPKRKTGTKVDWTPRLRTMLYQFGQMLMRQNGSTPYSAYYLEQKAKHSSRTDITKGHIHSLALNNAGRLFLSHFFSIARTLDNKPVPLPYQFAILGHSDYIPPYHWDGEIKFTDLVYRPDILAQDTNRKVIAA